MGQVKITFETQTSHGLYRDALYFQEEEIPPEDEIERLKQERVDNWVAFVTALTQEKPPQDG